MQSKDQRLSSKKYVRSDKEGAMGKKNKEKGKTRKKRIEEEGQEQDEAGKSRVGKYADGHPLDQIQYLEAKLILKPDRFTSVESFRDFGKLVKKTAKREDVEFIPDAEAGLRPNIREILFLDTPDFRLYNNAFILRRRITYVDGFPWVTLRSFSSIVIRMRRQQRQ
jgi:hypothetical protein